MNVPFLDLPQQNKKLKHEILQIWGELLDSASFIGGKQVELFENEFAKACETRHCVSVGSGTDALRLIFLAMNIKRGDEIITAPNTFIATTEAITQAGGNIVFCDIDAKSYNIDVNQLESKITNRTVGIVPVHLYGQPADMAEINNIAQKYGLWVVEDSCQAHLATYSGKRAGSLAHAAAFSFYPGKNLGACGEAGAITTNDSKLAERIKALRNHGQGKKYYHDYEGYNGRCDALQAAALRIKLPHLEDWCKLRQDKAQEYINCLSNMNLTLPTIAVNRTHVFHLFVILLENREKIIKYLNNKGISTGLHYPLPLHLQKAYDYLGLAEGSFPVTEKISKQLLSLPLFPELSNSQIKYVCNSLQEVL